MVNYIFRYDVAAALICIAVMLSYFKENVIRHYNYVIEPDCSRCNKMHKNNRQNVKQTGTKTLPG